MFDNVNWKVASGNCKFHILMSVIVHNETGNFIHGKLTNVYDSFPNMIWNSGRVASGIGQLDLGLIEYQIGFYNRNNIGFSLVCSNTLLEEKHMNDKYGNRILEIANLSDLNSVIISTDVMFNHVKKHFPNLKTVHSCIPNISDFEYLKDKQSQYDVVVLPPKSNRKYSLISKLDVDKLEILVNEYCLRDCSIREKHYESLSQSALLNSPTNDYKEMNCPRRTMEYQECVKKTCLLPVKEVEFLNKEFGITKFKLQGRAMPDEYFIFDIIKYLCKPEMNSFVFREIMSFAMNSRYHIDKENYQMMLSKQQTERVLSQGGYKDGN